jgi:hypothetical protein
MIQVRIEWAWRAWPSAAILATREKVWVRWVGLSPTVLQS